MSYLFFAVALYLVGKCCWEVYLYFFDRSMFERMRAKVEDDTEGEGEDIQNPLDLFIAYPFLIGGFVLAGYLIHII